MCTTTSCSSIHPSVDVWFPSSFGLSWIMLLWTGIYKYLFEMLLSVLLDKCPEVELLGYMVILFLTFWGASILFPQWVLQVTLPPEMHRDPPHPHQLLFSGFLMVAIQMVMRWISLCFSFVYPRWLVTLSIFSCTSLEKCLFKAVAHFLTRLLIFCCCWVGRFFF